MKVSRCSLIGSVFAFATFAPHQAIAQGMEGSYLGSPLEDDSVESLLQFFEADQLTQPSEALKLYTEPATESPIQLQGRLDIPDFPFSVRGTAYSSQDAKAILPTISYDHAVHDDANIYAGVGYVFVETIGENSDTPLGNQNGVVLTTGIEAKVMDDFILFGDAKLRLDAYSEQMEATKSPVQFQFGIGYGF